jgi:hypothetical protein
VLSAVHVRQHGGPAVFVLPERLPDRRVVDHHNLAVAVRAIDQRFRTCNGSGSMKIQRRQFLHLASGAVALPAVSRIARAQTYPTRYRIGAARSQQASAPACVSYRNKYSRGGRKSWWLLMT